MSALLEASDGSDGQDHTLKSLNTQSGAAKDLLFESYGSAPCVFSCCRRGPDSSAEVSTFFERGASGLRPSHNFLHGFGAVGAPPLELYMVLAGVLGVWVWPVFHRLGLTCFGRGQGATPVPRTRLYSIELR